jgi:hypothetical protein
MDADADLTGPRVPLGQLDDLQRLRTTELDHTHRSHGGERSGR